MVSLPSCAMSLPAYQSNSAQNLLIQKALCVENNQKRRNQKNGYTSGREACPKLGRIMSRDQLKTQKYIIQASNVSNLPCLNMVLAGNFMTSSLNLSQSLHMLVVMN